MDESWMSKQDTNHSNMHHYADQKAVQMDQINHALVNFMDRSSPSTNPNKQRYIVPNTGGNTSKYLKPLAREDRYGAGEGGYHQVAMSQQSQYRTRGDASKLQQHLSPLKTVKNSQRRTFRNNFKLKRPTQRLDIDSLHDNPVHYSQQTNRISVNHAISNDVSRSQFHHRPSRIRMNLMDFATYGQNNLGETGQINQMNQ